MKSYMKEAHGHWLALEHGSDVAQVLGGQCYLHSIIIIISSNNNNIIIIIILSSSLSGSTHLLIWVVQTVVSFYFMPGAQQQT
jgi:hypothetical protein